MANLQTIPAIVIEADDRKTMELALIENLQRQDLDFWEEALALRQLIDAFHLSQEEAARRIGKSQSAVANKLRLLKLPPEALEVLREGGCSERHARALLRLPAEADQLALVELAAQRKLSVSLLEKQVDACLSRPALPEKRVSAALRDSRMVVNALLDTVRQLTRIGVPVQSQVEEGEGCVRVIVTIPAVRSNAPTA